ncbi:MAG: hypothetical protein ACYCW6_14715 [Candidatus Xenobia bacterium]
MEGIRPVSHHAASTPAPVAAPREESVPLPRDAADLGRFVKVDEKPRRDEQQAPKRQRRVVPVPEDERAFVDAALSDPEFGGKHHYILRELWGYDLPPAPAPAEWAPDPPLSQPPGPPLPDDGTARSFSQVLSAAGQARSVKLEGMERSVMLYDAGGDEVQRIERALSAVPAHARDFLELLSVVAVADIPRFRHVDGRIETRLFGIVDYPHGQMLLNRLELDADWRWLNTICHELGHFHDNWLEKPSSRPGSPMGRGAWFTTYAWHTQDPAEDLAEGYALLCQKRLTALGW